MIDGSPLDVLPVAEHLRTLYSLAEFGILLATLCALIMVVCMVVTLTRRHGFRLMLAFGFAAVIVASESTRLYLAYGNICESHASECSIAAETRPDGITPLDSVNRGELAIERHGSSTNQTK